MAIKPKNMIADISESFGRNGRYFRLGTQDNFYNLIVDYINNSGTATQCIERCNQFVYGKGFKSEVFGKQKVNKDQVLNDLAEEIIQQINYYNGFAIQVKFNNNGDPSRYYILDLKTLRLREDGQFIYNPYFGERNAYNYHKKANDVIIPPYYAPRNEHDITAKRIERKKMVADQIKRHGQQYGQILRVFKKGIGFNYDKYPVPSYVSGLNDILADGGLSVHEDTAVNNGFNAGVVVITHKMDRSQKDDEGLSEYDHFVESQEQFIGADAAPIFHIETDLSKDQDKPMIIPLNVQHQMDATENATMRIAKKVARLFGVPPVLIGIDTEGKLGDNQELVNKLKLFNLTLETKRRLIYKGLSELFPDAKKEDYELTPLDLFDHIPDNVIAQLNMDQLKEMYNIPEIKGVNGEPVTTNEVSATNENMRKMSGREFQHLARIARELGKGKINEVQAIMQVVSGFGMTEDEAKKYLGIDEITN